MCGRFVLAVNDPNVLQQQFNLDSVEGFSPRFNVAPTQNAPIITNEHPKELSFYRWGLVPSWAKDPSAGGRLINARSETVTEKPSFRNAASRRRCLVPASGYYEWMPVDGGKQPYYLHPESDGLVAFAGLYEQWWPKDQPDADPLWTATIITTAAPDALGVIHDRTPVILPASMWSDWLSPAITERADVAGMLAAVPEPRLVPRPVGRAVGNVRNQGPGLIEPVEV